MYPLPTKHTPSPSGAILPENHHFPRHEGQLDHGRRQLEVDTSTGGRVYSLTEHPLEPGKGGSLTSIPTGGTLCADPRPKGVQGSWIPQKVVPQQDNPKCRPRSLKGGTSSSDPTVGNAARRYPPARCAKGLSKCETLGRKGVHSANTLRPAEIRFYREALEWEAVVSKWLEETSQPPRPSRLKAMSPEVFAERASEKVPPQMGTLEPGSPTSSTCETNLSHLKGAALNCDPADEGFAKHDPLPPNTPKSMHLKCTPRTGSPDGARQPNLLVTQFPTRGVDQVHTLPGGAAKWRTLETAPSRPVLTADTKVESSTCSLSDEPTGRSGEEPPAVSAPFYQEWLKRRRLTILTGRRLTWTLDGRSGGGR